MYWLVGFRIDRIKLLTFGNRNWLCARDASEFMTNDVRTMKTNYHSFIKFTYSVCVRDIDANVDWGGCRSQRLWTIQYILAFNSHAAVESKTKQYNKPPQWEQTNKSEDSSINEQEKSSSIVVIRLRKFNARCAAANDQSIKRTIRCILVNKHWMRMSNSFSTYWIACNLLMHSAAFAVLTIEL